MPTRTTLCRCEDLTLAEIREYIAAGYHTVDEIKRISRCGMGPCQGRSCRTILVGEIALATGQRVEDIKQPKFRPPTEPIALSTLLGGDRDDT